MIQVIKERTAFRTCTAVVGVILLVPVLAGYGCSLCSNRMITEVKSPRASHKAVLFERDCGATTGFVIHVSLLRASDVLPSGKGNVFVADDDHGRAPLAHQGKTNIDLCWRTERDLLIRYPERARIFLRATEVDAVRISYEPIPHGGAKPASQ